MWISQNNVQALKQQCDSSMSKYLVFSRQLLWRVPRPFFYRLDPPSSMQGHEWWLDGVKRVELPTDQDTNNTLIA